MDNRTPQCTSPFTWMFYFLAGSVTGASVALLMAPRSGRETREMMRSKLTDTASSARDLKDQVIRRGQEIRAEARHRLDGAVSALAGDGGAVLPG